MMMVVSTVFSYVFRFDIENYPVYLITGQTLFNFFQEATNMAMTSITNSASLIKKVYLPKQVFPVSRILSSFVTFCYHYDFDESENYLDYLIVSTSAVIHSCVFDWIGITAFYNVYLF